MSHYEELQSMKEMLRKALQSLAKLASERAALQAERDQLRVALEEISDPIGFMRKEAEAQGCKLEGQWAVELSESANYLKEIASKALRDRASLSESGSRDGKN